MSRICMETMQSNIFDGKTLPRNLEGMYAPLAVWEYVFALQRKIEWLESELADSPNKEKP